MIRNHFSTLETHTASSDGEVIIKAFLTNEISKGKREKFDMRQKKIEGPPHILLFMMKENVESMSAVSHLAKMFHKAGKYIGIAGNKDK